MYSNSRGSGHSSPGRLFVYLLLLLLIGIAILRVAQLSGGGFDISYSDLSSGTSAPLVSEDSDRLVPIYYQFDDRWAEIAYCNDTVKTMGCGPVCLSMCLTGLTGKNDYSPDYVVEFSKKHGYYVNDIGSRWTLISEGGNKLGLTVTELSLSKKKVINSLQEGNPVILVVGPGPFTDNGHFVVLSGYVDGKFLVNDPNSKANSKKTWEWEDFSDSIKNLWSLSL